MNKLLLIYNTCGLSGKNNYDHYVKSIDSFLAQNFNDYKLVISDCCGLEEVRRGLLNKYKNNYKIRFNYIDDILPVNITFNHSVLKAIKEFGNFTGYMFIDSGVDFEQDKNIVQNLYDLFKSGSYGMVTPWSEDDSGDWGWWPEGLPEGDYFKVQVGKAINLHAMIFSYRLVEFYGRPYPEIFAGQCSESVFSFVCAALKLNWVISKTIKVNHIKGVDGASFAFRDNPGLPWENLFRSPRTARELIEDPVGICAGFGYEENQNVLVHNPECFDENGWCKNEVLKYFIRDNLFLSKDRLDYDKINHQWI